MADGNYAPDDVFEVQHWLEHAETDTWMMAGPGLAEPPEEFYTYILASIRRTMYQLGWMAQQQEDPVGSALERAAAALEDVLEAEAAGDRLLARSLASRAATQSIPDAKRELGILDSVGLA